MSGKIRVLYIDDNPLDRELVFDALAEESKEFELILAANSKEFENHLQQGKWDIILSDFNILGYDGFKVMEAVQQLAPGTPVIIITGTGSEEMAALAIKKGAMDYVIKSHNHIKRLPGTIKNAIHLKDLENERRQAEEALRRREEELVRAQQVAHVGSWTYDPGTGEPSWSDEMFHVFGLEPKPEAPGYEDHRQFIHPDDWELFASSVQKAVDEGSGYDLELRITRPDGEIRYVNTRCEAVHDEKGTVTELIGTTQDITERKTVELELQKSKALLEATGSMARVGGWEVDVATKEVSWTDEVYRIHEVPLDYKPSLHEAIDFFHPNDRERLSLAIQQAMDRGTPYDMELRFISARGKNLWTRTKCHPVKEKNKVVKLFGTFQDISDRRKAEEQLARIFALSIDMICIADINTASFIKINPAFTDVLGYAENELLQRSFMDLIHPEDIEPTRKVVKDKLLAGEKVIGFVNRYRRKDGSYRWFSWMSYPIPEQGKTYAIARDITEQRNIENELKKSETRFRTLFENMPSGVAIYRVVDEGRDFIFTGFNAAAEEIDKIGREDVIGKRLTEVFTGVREFGLLDVMYRVWATGKDEYMPESLYRDDRDPGSYRENWVYRLPSGEIVAVYRDVTVGRQTKERLKEALLRQKEAVRAGKVGLWDWDLVTNKVHYSPEWKEQIGYEDHEITDDYEEWRSRIHPDDLEQVVEKVQKSIDECRQDHQVEFRFRHKDGSYRWILVHASIQQDDAGRPVRMVGAHVDITDWKKAQLALRESEEKYRSLFENMMNGFALHEIIVDGQGEPVDYIFREINDAFEELTGLKRKAVIGKKATEVLPGIENDHAGWIRRYGEIALAGREERFEQYSTVLGKYYYVLVYSPQENQFATIFEDITDRKQAEENLRRNRSQLNSLVNNLFDALLVTDMNGIILFANPAACKLFGKDHDQLLGLEFGFPTVLDEAFEISVKVQEDLYHAEARATLTDWSGEKAYLISLRDVTAHRRAEEEKVTLENQLQQSQKLESIGQLAGGIAHDFNNMLSVILGYGDDLLGDLHPNDPMRESVQEIVNAGKRSAALTRQLLAFSRRQTLQPEVLNLNELVRNLEKMLHRLIGENIELCVQLAEDLEHVEVDPGQIEQVIMNLAVNARDAMPLGGRLTIQTRNVTLDGNYAETHIGVRQGNYVLLCVSDTGCGMDEEIRAKIFDPFFSTKGKGRGTGLGLSTVYGIIKQSGGYIWVYSEQDQGTSFKIYLPRTAAIHVREKAAKKDGAQEGNRELILMVEDEPSLRMLTERFLKSLNYRVASAANGGEALLLVEEKKLTPDLVLSDVVMPGMSGRVLVDRLKKDLPDLKVLYMSGYTDDAIAHHGILETGTPFIQKPFNKNDLGKLLREIIEND